MNSTNKIETNGMSHARVVALISKAPGLKESVETGLSDREGLFLITNEFLSWAISGANGFTSKQKEIVKPLMVKKSGSVSVKNQIIGQAIPLEIAKQFILARGEKSKELLPEKDFIDFLNMYSVDDGNGDVFSSNLSAFKFAFTGEKAEPHQEKQAPPKNESSESIFAFNDLEKLINTDISERINKITTRVKKFFGESKLPRPSLSLFSIIPTELRLKKVEKNQEILFTLAEAIQVSLENQEVVNKTLHGHLKTAHKVSSDLEATVNELRLEIKALKEKPKK